MRISSKGDYGLRALVDLAQHHDTSIPVQVREIAQRQHVPEEYLGQLMVGLRRAGLVHSVRGASGGYLLARPPGEITVAEVLETLEGSLAIADGLDRPPGPGARRAPGGAIRELLWQATQAALEVLQRTTVADLAAKESAQSHTYYI